jgi:hypothetical protein
MFWSYILVLGLVLRSYTFDISVYMHTDYFCIATEIECIM